MKRKGGHQGGCQTVVNYPNKLLKKSIVAVVKVKQALCKQLSQASHLSLGHGVPGFC